MRRAPGALQIGLLAIALLVGACGGDSGGGSMTGTYNCGSAEATESIIELREDGTMTLDIIADPGPPGESTWSVEGDEVVLNSGTPEEDRFTIEGENFVQGPFVCRPAS